MEKKDIKEIRALFITPPLRIWKGEVEKPFNTTQPLGLAYVAAAARAAGATVEAIDAYSLGMSGQELERRIAAFAPDLVGISILTPQWADALKVAELTKAVNPGILTVAGGPHVTALPEAVVAGAGVDVAVIGEGEDAIQDICRAMAAGDDLKEVAGLALAGDGAPLRTPPRPYIRDLDRLAFPAHDLLPEPTFYNPYPSWGKKGNFSSIISGRGCPYRCCFCDVTSQQGKQYRLRSAANIVEEMEWLNRDFNVTMFSFRDPSMFCNRRRLMEIHQLIKEKQLDVVWTCNGRANEVDAELLKALQEAGCRRIQFGIEVGNAKMLKDIKGLTKAQVARAVTETGRAGIAAHGYFMFGFLEETPDTIEETIDFALELDLDSASFAVMVPFPGTKEFDLYQQEGLLLTEDWRDYDITGKPVYRHKHLTNEQLAGAPRRAYRRFYLRPRVIARYLKRLNSWWAIRNYMHSAWAVLR